MTRPEVAAGQQLAAQQAAASERFGKNINLKTTTDMRVHKLWSGHPTTVREAAIVGMGVAYGPTNLAQLAESVVGFVSSVRGKVGEGKVNQITAIDMIYAEPKRVGNVNNPTNRDHEVNGARYYAEVLTDELLPVIRATEDPNELAGLQMQVAITATKMQHLAAGLSSNSEYNPAYRLKLIEDLILETGHPDGDAVYISPEEDLLDLSTAVPAAPPPPRERRVEGDDARREITLRVAHLFGETSEAPKPRTRQGAGHELREQLRTRVTEIFEAGTDQSA